LSAAENRVRPHFWPRLASLFVCSHAIVVFPSPCPGKQQLKSIIRSGAAYFNTAHPVLASSSWCTVPFKLTKAIRDPSVSRPQPAYSAPSGHCQVPTLTPCPSGFSGKWPAAAPVHPPPCHVKAGAGVGLGGAGVGFGGAGVGLGVGLGVGFGVGFGGGGARHLSSYGCSFTKAMNAAVPGSQNVQKNAQGHHARVKPTSSFWIRKGPNV
jgi:hypothetical protein